MNIVQATHPKDFDAFRMLMRNFLLWLRERHRDDSSLIDRYFTEGGLEAELAALPGNYAPPGGRLLLACHDGQPAGCVALRDIGEGICEMKRMFVSDAFHRQGIGRALVVQLLAEAKAAGYARMRLDTGPRQHEARRLYETVGFRRIPPYYTLPEDLRTWLLFFECDLGDSPALP